MLWRKEGTEAMLFFAIKTMDFAIMEFVRYAKIDFTVAGEKKAWYHV